MSLDRGGGDDDDGLLEQQQLSHHHRPSPFSSPLSLAGADSLGSLDIPFSLTQVPAGRPQDSPPFGGDDDVDEVGDDDDGDDGDDGDDDDDDDGDGDDDAGGVDGDDDLDVDRALNVDAGSAENNEIGAENADITESMYERETEVMTSAFEGNGVDSTNSVYKKKECELRREGSEALAAVRSTESMGRSAAPAHQPMMAAPFMSLTQPSESLVAVGNDVNVHTGPASTDYAVLAGAEEQDADAEEQDAGLVDFAEEQVANSVAFADEQEADSVDFADERSSTKSGDVHLDKKMVVAAVVDACVVVNQQRPQQPESLQIEAEETRLEGNGDCSDGYSASSTCPKGAVALGADQVRSAANHADTSYTVRPTCATTATAFFVDTEETQFVTSPGVRHVRPSQGDTSDVRQYSATQDTQTVIESVYAASNHAIGAINEPPMQSDSFNIPPLPLRQQPQPFVFERPSEAFTRNIAPNASSGLHNSQEFRSADKADSSHSVDRRSDYGRTEFTQFSTCTVPGTAAVSTRVELLPNALESSASVQLIRKARDVNVIDEPVALSQWTQEGFVLHEAGAGEVDGGGSQSTDLEAASQYIPEPRLDRDTLHSMGLDDGDDITAGDVSAAPMHPSDGLDLHYSPVGNSQFLAAAPAPKRDPLLNADQRLNGPRPAILDPTVLSQPGTLTQPDAVDETYGEGVHTTSQAWMNPMPHADPAAISQTPSVQELTESGTVVVSKAKEQLPSDITMSIAESPRQIIAIASCSPVQTIATEVPWQPVLSVRDKSHQQKEARQRQSKSNPRSTRAEAKARVPSKGTAKSLQTKLTPVRSSRTSPSTYFDENIKQDKQAVPRNHTITQVGDVLTPANSVRGGSSVGQARADRLERPADLEVLDVMRDDVRLEEGSTSSEMKDDEIYDTTDATQLPVLASSRKSKIQKAIAKSGRVCINESTDNINSVSARRLGTNESGFGRSIRPSKRSHHYSSGESTVDREGSSRSDQEDGHASGNSDDDVSEYHPRPSSTRRRSATEHRGISLSRQLRELEAQSRLKQKTQNAIDKRRHVGNDSQVQANASVQVIPILLPTPAVDFCSDVEHRDKALDAAISRSRAKPVGQTVQKPSVETEIEHRSTNKRLKPKRIDRSFVSDDQPTPARATDEFSRSDDFTLHPSSSDGATTHVRDIQRAGGDSVRGRGKKTKRSDEHTKPSAERPSRSSRTGAAEPSESMSRQLRRLAEEARMEQKKKNAAARASNLVSCSPGKQQAYVAIIEPQQLLEKGISSQSSPVSRRSQGLRTYARKTKADMALVDSSVHGGSDYTGDEYSYKRSPSLDLNTSASAASVRPKKASSARKVTSLSAPSISQSFTKASRKPAEIGMFSKMWFLCVDASAKTTQAIRRHGGRLIASEEFNLARSPPNIPSSMKVAMTRKFRGDEAPQVVCISSSLTGDLPILFCLLVRIPVLVEAWVDKCVSSQQLQWPAVSDEVLPSYNRVKKYRKRPRLFEGLNIELCAESDEWKTAWTYLLRDCGGARVREKLFSPSPISKGSLDMLLCEADALNPSYEEQMRRRGLWPRDAEQASADTAKLNDKNSMKKAKSSSRAKRERDSLFHGLKEARESQSEAIELPVLGETWAILGIQRLKLLPTASESIVNNGVEDNKISAAAVPRKRHIIDASDDELLNEEAKLTVEHSDMPNGAGTNGIVGSSIDNDGAAAATPKEDDKSVLRRQHKKSRQG